MNLNIISKVIDRKQKQVRKYCNYIVLVNSQLLIMKNIEQILRKVKQRAASVPHFYLTSPSLIFHRLHREFQWVRKKYEHPFFSPISKSIKKLFLISYTFIWEVLFLISSTSLNQIEESKNNNNEYQVGQKDIEDKSCVL